MSLLDTINRLKTIEQGITDNKVSKFAYTDTAYTNNDVNGVQVYNINNEQNIPVADADILQVNTTITNKGYRTQASSLTRMLVNHFFGRVSYNLNKANDILLSLLNGFSSYLGQPNGVATLDENGRIPYNQLPESAVEYKGEWNASTNTPTLVDGTGTNGNMYYVSEGGTQNLGSGDITFLEGDRIIYNGEDEVWQKLSGGAVKTVNSVLPDSTGNVDLNFSNISGTLAGSKLVNNAVTTSKIANNAVTPEKIIDDCITSNKIAENAVTNRAIGETISIAKGGTGATTEKEAEYNLLSSMPSSDVDISDTTTFAIARSTPSEINGVLVKKTGLNLWSYIQNKISTVLGLTSASYNGVANSALSVINSSVLICSTASSTASKTVDLPNFVLTTGARISVSFFNGNSVSTPTLNVNNTGAIQIRGFNDKTIKSPYGSSSDGCYTWTAKTVLDLFYNGTYWQVIGNPIVHQMGTSNFLKVYLNGYKEGSIQYSFTLNPSTSPQTHQISETSLIGSSVERLRLPVMLGFKNTSSDVTRTLKIDFQNLTAGIDYSGTRTICLEISGALLAGTQVTCTLNYAGY